MRIMDFWMFRWLISLALTAQRTDLLPSNPRDPSIVQRLLRSARPAFSSVAIGG
jgi:hypothetical protein